MPKACIVPGHSISAKPNVAISVFGDSARDVDSEFFILEIMLYAFDHFSCWINLVGLVTFISGNPYINCLALLDILQKHIHGAFRAIVKNERLPFLRDFKK